MIVLDTNVLSEVLRPAPDHRVMAWLDEQPRASIFTSGTLCYAQNLSSMPESPETVVAFLEAVDVSPLLREGRCPSGVPPVRMDVWPRTRA